MKACFKLLKYGIKEPTSNLKRHLFTEANKHTEIIKLYENLSQPTEQLKKRKLQDAFSVLSSQIENVKQPKIG